VKNAYKALIGKSEGNKPLGGPRRGWKDGIAYVLRENGLQDFEWIYLTEIRCESALMNTVLAGRIKDDKFLD
jgi:hypothetical protein